MQAQCLKHCPGREDNAKRKALFSSVISEVHAEAEEEKSVVVHRCTQRTERNIISAANTEVTDTELSGSDRATRNTYVVGRPNQHLPDWNEQDPRARPSTSETNT